MATEILLNDGGAPARIMKVANAAADIDAGTFVIFDGTNVAAANADLPDQSNAIGVLNILELIRNNNKNADKNLGLGLERLQHKTVYELINKGEYGEKYD